ncbi:uncharacterized protein LOC141984348 [Natator depressus]|uniref:uncharacterized protein LOC141984348 n=1 Tax=Natator depressus TaxID=27790 RepID=UPI003EC0C510
MQSQNRRRAPAWTEREVLDLIAVWGEEFVLAELRSKRRNANTYGKVSKAGMDRGYNREPQQCCVKIKELRQAYQKTKEANGHSRSEPQTCRLYAEPNAILAGAATTTPSASMDTSIGGLSVHGDGKFGDNDSEDEKDEDSAARGSGETVLLNSQDLFITLQPVPSQPSTGRIPDCDASQGTSAANVSTPTQRLTQIRQQKNRTRDEMFTGLMQSSRTERAQQNVWR